MLTVKNSNVYEFVSTNAKRDANELAGIVMYDLNPLTNEERIAFDGGKWIGERISVEPEGTGVLNG